MSDCQFTKRYYYYFIYTTNKFKIKSLIKTEFSCICNITDKKNQVTSISKDKYSCKLFFCSTKNLCSILYIHVLVLVYFNYNRIS